MSEKFESNNFYSKEKEYIIDPESGYFKAIAFASDSVAYCRDCIRTLIDEGFEDDSLCQQVLADIMEIEEIISNEDIAVKDGRVRAMLELEYGSESWVRVTFTILKEAGLTQEQALAWVILDDPELTSEELLKERTVRYFIQDLYSESI